MISKERKIIYILCFLLLLVGFFLLLGLKDARECLANPFVYGANNIETGSTGGVHCTCTFASPLYSRFYFDSDSIEVLRGE